jgi:hypothetical protein
VLGIIAITGSLFCESSEILHCLQAIFLKATSNSLLSHSKKLTYCFEAVGLTARAAHGRFWVDVSKFKGKWLRLKG